MSGCVIICSFGLQEGHRHLVFCCCYHKCSGHSQYCMWGVSFLAQLFDKVSRQFLVHGRMAMFVVPVFAFLPVDGGKVDELVEDVFLISVDIKNVRLI